MGIIWQILYVSKYETTVELIGPHCCWKEMFIPIFYRQLHETEESDLM